MYRLHISENHSLDGYLNSSLSYFNTSEFTISRSNIYNQSVEICRYPDLREPPWSSKPYKLTILYWTVLAARLGFVVIFEVIIFTFLLN